MIWVAVGIAYFLIGINLSSSDRRIVTGLLAVALGTLIVWVSYRSLMK